MSQIILSLVLLIFAAGLSTFDAQEAQCDYLITINTGPTKGPTHKLRALIEAVGGGNINTTNLVKRWGAMGKGHTYFLPNSSDRFMYSGRCFPARFCYFQIRGKKGELNPHWYINNITVVTNGEGIYRVREFLTSGEEVFYTYPSFSDGECP